MGRMADIALWISRRLRLAVMALIAVAALKTGASALDGRMNRRAPAFRSRLQTRPYRHDTGGAGEKADRKHLRLLH